MPPARKAVDAEGAGNWSRAVGRETPLIVFKSMLAAPLHARRSSARAVTSAAKPCETGLPSRRVRWEENDNDARTLSKKRTCCRRSAVLALPVAQAQACTSFLLKAGDGGYVYGRTLEFGLPLQSRIIAIPKNYAFSGTGPDGTAGSGLGWTAKYATGGANAFGLPILADGMNEAGLAGGMLYLPGLAQYQSVRRRTPRPRSRRTNCSLIS